MLIFAAISLSLSFQLHLLSDSSPLPLPLPTYIYWQTTLSHLRIYKILSCESSNRHYYPIKVRGNYEGQSYFNHDNRGQGSHLEDYSNLHQLNHSLRCCLKYTILYIDLGSSCIPHGPAQRGGATTRDIGLGPTLNLICNWLLVCNNSVFDV